MHVTGLDLVIDFDKIRTFILIKDLAYFPGGTYENKFIDEIQAAWKTRTNLPTG
jgi:hypothetical protein